MTTPSDPDSLRAGNVERERVVGLLNAAFAEGRLDVTELEERVAAAYAAKTLGQLRPLTADLPGGGVVEPARPARAAPASRSAGAEARRARAGGNNPGGAVAGMAGVFALNVLIWGIVSASTGGLVYFWPAWLLIPLFIAVVAQAGARRR